MPTPTDLARPFADWLAAHPGPVAVLCHSDGDGLTSGAILTHALRRAGRTVAVEVTGKGGGAWHPDTAAKLLAHRPAALVVADLGCRAEPVLPGVPACFIDHHRPAGTPPGDLLVTGYGTDPTPTSGLLAWECGKLVADVDDLDWLAAISLLSDLGDAPFPLLQEVRARHKITHLRDATALLNAPRRSAAGDAWPALELLLKAGGPKDVTAGDFAEVSTLKSAKAEVAAAFAEAKKAAPQIVGDLALVRVHSPCQVHPMVAQIWRTRLAKNIVMVANSGYLPGRVNFSMRTATGKNILDFLRRHAPPEAGPDYGNGHDQAAGGSLPVAVWEGFIRSLGFGTSGPHGPRAVFPSDTVAVAPGGKEDRTGTVRATQPEQA